MIEQTKSFHQATKKTTTLNDLCDQETLQKLGRPCLNSVMQYFRVSEHYPEIQYQIKIYDLANQNSLGMPTSFLQSGDYFA